MADNNGHDRPPRKRTGPKIAPWKRWLAEPMVVVDEEEGEQWRPALQALLLALVDLPTCWHACAHLVLRAAAGKFVVGWSCQAHPQLLCNDCIRAHIEDVEVEHDGACVVPACPKPGVQVGQLLVFHDQVPIGDPDSEVATRSFGGRTILGPLCMEHGAGRRWTWPEMVEPQQAAS